MRTTRALAFSFGLISLTFRAEGADLPTSLTCRSNAKASRDYAFSAKRWEGETNANASAFAIETRDTKVGQFYSLRDKVFSGLDGRSPTVRSITRYVDGSTKGEEFSSSVVIRTADAVFLLWTNEINKTWLASIDLARRKATVVQAFQGVTSIGGEIETLDCQ